MNIKAPISGVITELSVNKGQYITAEESLAEILDSSKLWARIHVYQNDLPHINVGSNVEILSAVDASVKSFGTIISKSNAFMRGKKSIEIIASINQPEQFITGSNINSIIYNSAGKKHGFYQTNLLLTKTANILFLNEKQILISRRKK